MGDNIHFHVAIEIHNIDVDNQNINHSPTTSKNDVRYAGTVQCYLFLFNSTVHEVSHFDVNFEVVNLDVDM